MVFATRAFIVVATCLYLKRIAEQKRAILAAARVALEVEDDIVCEYTGESATLSVC